MKIFIYKIKIHEQYFPVTIKFRIQEDKQKIGKKLSGGKENKIELQKCR